jgi:hypothetical protein
MFNSKIDSNLDMTKVKALYDHYHAKTKTNPTLYQSGDECITVILPQGLLDYCNASAGNSGGSNARPCGIRYSVRNSTKALEQIFESVDSLARFISGSDCDGMYFAERTRHMAVAKTQVINVNPLDRPMCEFKIEELYGKGMIMTLRNKYPKTVMGDFATLTRGEFEARYALVAITPNMPI